MSESRILLISAGLVHPPWKGRRILRRILAGHPGIQIRRIRSLEKAAALGLGGFKALILYYHFKDAALTDAALGSFDSYVKSGGGVLAVHSATASYKKTPEYFDIIGGRFAGHGPVETFEIKPTGTAPGLFADIGSFHITDELYLHNHGTPIESHMIAEFGGKDVPMVWTREHGDGRICYIAPGHLAESLRHPAIVKIISRGLNWVLNR